MPPDLHEMSQETLCKIPEETQISVLCRQIREQKERIDYLNQVINEQQDYISSLLERVKNT